MSETLTPVYRIEHFIKAAADGTPCDLTPVFNEEVYLAKIAGVDIDELPAPTTRVQQYLAKIAGMDVDIPEPVFRNEMYLAEIAGMDIEAPAPFYRNEQFLAYWVENSGEA